MPSYGIPNTEMTPERRDIQEQYRKKSVIQTPIHANDIITITSPQGIKRKIEHFAGTLTLEGRPVSEYAGMTHELGEAIKRREELKQRIALLINDYHGYLTLDELTEKILQEIEEEW